MRIVLHGLLPSLWPAIDHGERETLVIVRNMTKPMEILSAVNLAHSRKHLDDDVILSALNRTIVLAIQGKSERAFSSDRPESSYLMGRHLRSMFALVTCEEDED